MIYIASPYSDKDKNVMNNRYEKVKEFTAELMRKGLTPYSPIVHGHDIATTHSLPTDWQFWQRQCLAMLRKADKMIVLKLDGWNKSVGVKAELEFCKACAIDVEYQDMHNWIESSSINDEVKSISERMKSNIVEESKDYGDELPRLLRDIKEEFQQKLRDARYKQ